MISYAAEPLHSVHVYAEYDGASTATGGYVVHNFTLGSQTLYSAAYYDGYSFIGRHGVPSSLAASAVPGFPIDATLGKGLQTGSATAVISNGGVTGYTYSAMYYAPGTTSPRSGLRAASPATTSPAPHTPTRASHWA